MTDRERDVAVALGLVGKSNDYFKNIWLEFASGWDGASCSETACCISFMAGNLNKIPVSNYAAGLVQKFKEYGLFGKSPAIGAFIWFDYHDGNGPSHTGRVVNMDNNYVYTIEGNINGKVVSRRYFRTSSYIYGYGYPYYEDIQMKFGIDISRWNGDFSIEQARDYHGVEFVIIKGGGGDDGMYVDSQFKNNYSKAKSAEVPCGCYWFSKALTLAEAKKEAEYFYNNCIAGRKFELPIYIDVEEQNMISVGRRLLTDIIKAWCDYMQSKGCYVGIYSTANVLQNMAYDNELQGYAHWIAFWGKSYTYDKTIGGMWQFGAETNYLRSKYINGQIVDQNYMYVDYPTIIKNGGYNGYEKPKPKARYSDVPTTSAYYSMCEWAYENGIAKGYSDGTFKLDNKCTRAQFIMMIWRMAGKPAAKRYVEFKDLAKFGSAKQAILWAASEGIVKGYSSGYFGVNDAVTRGQAALIMWRWLGKPNPTIANPFKDMDSRLSSNKAIIWGYEKGIIKGYSDKTFRPNDPCLRKHAITFLYRISKIYSI